MASLYNIDIPDLPADHIPLDAIVVVKALDNDGDPCVLIRHTAGINWWERIGMLQITLDRCRMDAQGGMTEESLEDLEDEMT